MEGVRYKDVLKRPFFTIITRTVDLACKNFSRCSPHGIPSTTPCVFSRPLYPTDSHYNAQHIKNYEQGNSRTPRRQQEHETTDRGQPGALQAGGSSRFPSLFHSRRTLQGGRHVPVQPGLLPGIARCTCCYRKCALYHRLFLGCDVAH